MSPRPPTPPAAHPRANPGSVLDARDVELLLRAAVRAPSLHNSQPWAFAFGDRHVEVYADASRQLPHADATGRSLLVSCGAALFNLRVAATHLGRHPRIRVLPDDADPTLVALVDVGHRQGRPDGLDGFYRAVWLRRTNRLPFHDRRISPTALSRLAEAAAMEGAVLRVYDGEAEVQRIVELLQAADRADHADPARVTERQAWVGGHYRQEGVPARSLGPRPTGADTPFRDLGHAVSTPRESAVFEATPTIAVLSTDHDRPVDWVRAGQALERVLLEATLSGLSVSFLNQPLEHRTLRRLVRNPLTGAGHSQMLLRIGYGDEVPLTPRRALQDVRRPPRSPG
jgi:nitroreductase